MKYIVFIIAFITVVSCHNDDLNECTKVEFNNSFITKVGKKYCINDTDYLLIRSIDNQLCPCDALCIWEGEFIINMKVVIDSIEHIFDFGSSRGTVGKLPFHDFNMIYESITPHKCDAFTQEDFRVIFKLEK